MLLGCGVGAGVYFLLHVEFVHELVSEQVALDETSVKIIAGRRRCAGDVYVPRDVFGKRRQSKRRSPVGMFLHLFDRGVEKVTGGYAAILGRSSLAAS